MSGTTAVPARPRHAPRSAPASGPARPAPGGGRGALKRHWDRAPGYQRLAYLAGAALIVVGLAHAAIWAVVGGSAAGPLSWRKPTTFGLSFGMTTVTLAWVATYLPVRRWVGWGASVLLSASTTAEVAWVTVQHARGVASHFNDTTRLDDDLFTLGGASIGFTILVSTVMTFAAFARCTAPAPMAWAIRAGLVALLAAQAVGAWMITHGLALTEAGATPLTRSLSTYGAEGAMKFAHSVPMHAIQVFVIQAGLLAATTLTRRTQLRLVVSAIAGYAALSAIVVARTASGLPPADLGVSTLAYLPPGVLLTASAVVTLIHAHRAVTRVDRRRTEPA
ncbi:hypothetical protein [Sphaerisporangium sp. TRM90804]|uniref:hypothetical protein n=1 Tax=Sphaerisporangium sp. TRM90804 TaxID=3031113 RepID=UPI0024489C77|nr:hypothetical protein [Sphaerisporangium sp. TRM90804]MDH2426510.1 hypothetical protein [Sphaerisporangium sp. TRM90804]